MADMHFDADDVISIDISTNTDVEDTTTVKASRMRKPVTKPVVSDRQVEVGPEGISLPTWNKHMMDRAFLAKSQPSKDLRTAISPSIYLFALPLSLLLYPAQIESLSILINIFQQA